MNIQEQISTLSNAEKILLVEKIWDSIDKEELGISDVQKQELDRRLDKHENGDTVYQEWKEVKKNLGKK